MSLELAIDYYQTSMTNKELAKKHGYNGPNSTPHRVKKYDPAIANMPKEDKVVIVVGKKDAEKASLILEGNGIKNHIPKKFEITEYIESKINTPPENE